MEENFKTLALSYKKSPIEIREVISLNEQEAKRLINLIKDTSQAINVLVLSTCNRTEVYYSATEVLTNEILKCLGIVKGKQNLSKYASYFDVITDHNLSVKHLFNVAMGLEAQVVGDMEISNQVKTAYQWSADEDAAGPFLHRLMHTVFFANKRVVQETSFRDGAASMSYAATELVSDLAQNYTDPRVLVVGLGEIGTSLCKNLSDSKLQNITITNRTLSRAEEVANGTNNFQVIPFENAIDAINNADIVVCSIANNKPFITQAIVEKIDLLSPKFFIDLSVPRSVAPDVENIPGALVYNIDDIQSKASEALNKRIEAIPHVKSIIEEALEELSTWTQEMEVSPTIKKLKNALEEIRKEEIERFVKKASESELEFLDKASKGMMQKVMKLPVLQLKAACKRGDAETLIDVLNDLFNLEQQSIEKQ
ncbi:MAG: glutamyl-tRNA reductase [Cyclobacteriaceae bacterium]|nr:glutamyl-tRNA reductase [Cyclobacteriaceae bacterium]